MAKKTPRDLSIEDIASTFGLSRKQIKSVITTATERTLKWGKIESARGLSSALNVPYRSIRKRMRIKGKTGRGNIWYGFNPIDLKYLDPIVSGGGVSARGKYYAGAFKVDSLGGHIFERTGERSEMKTGRYAGSVRDKIKKLSDPIDSKAEGYLEEFVGDAQNFFLEEMFKEIQILTGKPHFYNGIELTAINSLTPKLNT